MILKIFCNIIFITICISKHINAQISSSLLSGVAIAPEGAPRGPPGSINEETNQPPTISIKAPSEEEVIGR